MYYYIDKETKIFKHQSLVKLEDSDLIEVSLPPATGLSRWNIALNTWIELNEQEIAEHFPDSDFTEDVEGVNAPVQTTDCAVVLWDGQQGTGLKNSPLVYKSKTLDIAGNINVSGDFSINGNSITKAKDEQKIIKSDRHKYDQTSWQQIPNLHLTSLNLATSKYTIEVELLVHTTKSNRDFEFAIFINGKQDFANTLPINFNRANDDKTINWSDDFDLEPDSIITVAWRLVGNYCSCEIGRRKLKISQHQATGLSENSPEPEIDHGNWLFLGNGGIDFTHGNEKGNKIRYRQGMNLVRNGLGIYFTGFEPFRSWVKFEFLAWRRGQGKTLKIVFAASSGICQLGIGSDEISETSNSLFYNAEFNLYLNEKYLFGFTGNTGKIWQGTFTRLNKIVDSPYHRLEIENDGSPESAVRLYDLTGIEAQHWDDSSRLLYGGKIAATHTADANNILPWLIPTNGSGLLIAAIQVN